MGSDNGNLASSIAKFESPRQDSWNLEVTSRVLCQKLHFYLSKTVHLT